MKLLGDWSSYLPNRLHTPVMRHSAALHDPHVHPLLSQHGTVIGRLDSFTNALVPHALGTKADVTIVERELSEADIVIDGVLVPGALAPKLITRDMLGLMKPRSVIVDVAIRPRQLLRDIAPDHPRRSRVRGRRNPALLRGQHARRAGRKTSTGSRRAFGGDVPASS